MSLKKHVRSDSASLMRGQIVNQGVSIEVQEAAARCVSVMVCYWNENRSPTAGTMMIAEIRDVAAWFLMLSLNAGELERDLFKRVEEELVARYGRLTGDCLNDEFLEAFGAGWAG